MSDDDSDKRGLPFQKGYDPRRSTGNPDYHFKEGNDHSKGVNKKHGLYQSLSNLSEEHRLAIIEQGEHYVQAVKEVQGREELNTIEREDCYLLARLDFRIAQAEGWTMQNMKTLLEEDKVVEPGKLDKVVERRQDLRKDLGLHESSPEMRQASASEGFFEALGDNDE